MITRDRPSSRLDGGRVIISTLRLVNFAGQAMIMTGLTRYYFGCGLFPQTLAWFPFPRGGRMRSIQLRRPLHLPHAHPVLSLGCCCPTPPFLNELRALESCSAEKSSRRPRTSKTGTACGPNCCSFATGLNRKTLFPPTCLSLFLIVFRAANSDFHHLYVLTHPMTPPSTIRDTCGCWASGARMPRLGEDVGQVIHRASFRAKLLHYLEISMLAISVGC